MEGKKKKEQTKESVRERERGRERDREKRKTERKPKRGRERACVCVREIEKDIYIYNAKRVCKGERETHTQKDIQR